MPDSGACHGLATPDLNSQLEQTILKNLRISGKRNSGSLEALDLLQNLLSEINDVLTDDLSDEEVPANYLLEFSLDS
ncbi:hypothetical protein TNCV_4212881 [Trichonephila clavipes]|nr:hypothetical protein TNCV_4212881 [Trichonephila clavipes]